MVTVRASDIISGIGVNSHIPYTDGGYANIANVEADLSYLGVDELRDSISDGTNGSAPLSAYIELAKKGQRFTFYVGGSNSTTASIQSTLNLIEELEKTVPGSVKAIEGPNEINNFPVSFNGVGGLDGAVALQQYLFDTVKSTPALAGVAVDYFTGYDAGAIAMGPDPSKTPHLADYDNQHPYPNGGQAPAAWIDPTRALVNESAVKGPFVYTETGYTTALTSGNGVSADVQGKYTVDLLLDAAKAGASTTYLYQLMDAYKPGSPQGDDGYGLFDENNQPKVAAKGIHNLTSILFDNGPSAKTFTPSAVPYSVSGLPATGNTLEIQKSDGTTDIAVWAEPQIWDESTKSAITPPSSTVDVALDGAHQVSVYDPLVGSAPIAQYANTSSVQLQVTDHPIIVQVGASVVGSSGQPTSVGGVTTPTTGTTAGAGVGKATAVGSGPDKLVLGISEDAWQGDAQYTISVDGQEVGGTLTASASHAAGVDDTVTVEGDWSVGSHTIGVDFLNDAYGGTSSTDRNLYIDSATYDGVAVAGAARTLLSGGTTTFTVQDTTPANGNTSTPSNDGTVTKPGPSKVTTVGSGPDKLVLGISEDAWQGDAQYTISVDGQKIGDTLTASASHAAGAVDTVTVEGNWGVGSHTIGVDFLNDAYGGTSSTDRNLYIDSATYDGAAIAGAARTLLSGGTTTFAAQDATPISNGKVSSIGSGSDSLTLGIGEDAWNGDAQFTVSVDGKQVGGTMTASSLQSSTERDQLNIKGNWGSGSHKLTVDFLNDAYAGTTSTDRNLYVDGVTYDGKVVSSSTDPLFSAGPATITFTS